MRRESLKCNVLDIQVDIRSWYPAPPRSHRVRRASATVVGPAKKLSGVPEMLEKLEASGQRGAAASLGRARERLNGGLNSFVQGGIHPFTRHQAGYPIGLLMDVLKNSNAMGMLTLHVLSALPQQGEAVALAQALHAEFCDVLPPLKPLPSSTGTS